MDITMKSFLVTLLVSVAVISVQSLPADIVEDVDISAEIVELPSLKRSLGERKFKIKAFGKQLNLDLVKTQGLMPEVINVKFIGSDEDGNQTIDDWSHMTDQGQGFYSDLNSHAFLMIGETSGRTKLNGMLSDDLVIEWNDEEETTPNTLQHKVYKVKRLQGQVDVEDDSSVSKRQFDRWFGSSDPSKADNLYIGMHIVLDYKMYVKSGYNQASCITYAKTFIGSVNSLFTQLTAPTVQLMLQGITVFTNSQQSPTETYRQYHVGNSLHGNPLHFDLNHKWVTQNPGLFSPDVGSIMYLTGFTEMCGEKSADGKCSGVRGLAQIGSVCSAFPKDGLEWRLALVMDDFGYGGYKAAAHELGHQLGMSHDGLSTAQYARYGMPSSAACKYGIMSSALQEEPGNYKWSHCSQAQLAWWASQPGAACVKSPLSSKQQMSLPTVSADKQCKLRYGNSYSATKTDANVCARLQCKNRYGKSADNLFWTGAAPGTPCGNAAKCKYGECVRSDGAIVAAACVDDDKNCPGWAAAGECTRTFDFMTINCKKSCNRCTAGSSASCADANDNCEAWASIGECTKNPGYMLSNCKKSCKQCSSTGNSAFCADDDDNCEAWASVGECTKNPGYMLSYCKKSCRQCSSTGAGGVFG